MTSDVFSSSSDRLGVIGNEGTVRFLDGDNFTDANDFYSQYPSAQLEVYVGAGDDQRLYILDQQDSAFNGDFLWRNQDGTLDWTVDNIQEFGKPQDYIVSVQKQSDEEELEQSVVVIVKKILVDEFSGFVEFRRTETVGPVVSNQLKKDGAIALGAALIAMLMYIWFRFEWQFSLGAILALCVSFFVVCGRVEDQMYGIEYLRPGVINHRE